MTNLQSYRHSEKSVRRTSCVGMLEYMYSNIPTQEVINIIIGTANKNEIHRDIIKEMELITKFIIKQNYFEQNSIFYQ
jgi:hypothetical protein